MAGYNVDAGPETVRPIVYSRHFEDSRCLFRRRMRFSRVYLQIQIEDKTSG